MHLLVLAVPLPAPGGHGRGGESRIRNARGRPQPPQLLFAARLGVRKQGHPLRGKAHAVQPRGPHLAGLPTRQADVIYVEFVGSVSGAGGSAEYHAIREVPGVVRVATVLERAVDEIPGIRHCQERNESWRNTKSK